MKSGDTVLVHGKAVGTVVALHGGGKRVQVSYPNGQTRFVNAAAVKALTVPDWAEDRLRAVAA